MGHRGLKLFFLNINIFNKILNEYHSKILDDQQSEEYFEFIHKTMKILKSIEIDLIKLNFRKLLNSKQEIVQKYDSSKYFNRNDEVEIHYNTETIKAENNQGNLINIFDQTNKKNSENTKNKNNFSQRKKIKRLGFKDLTTLQKIYFHNSNSFIFKEYNTLIKFDSQAIYLIDKKVVNLFQNIKIFNNLQNNLENKLSFNSYKKRLEESLYTSYFSRYHFFFQKSFARLSYKNNKEESLKLFLGNIYVDNNYIVKSKFCIGKNPKINLKYIVSIDEENNSKIQLKTKNIDYLLANYKVNINKLVNISVTSNCFYFKKWNNEIEINYMCLKDVSFGIKSSFNYKFSKEKKIKNILSFGFNFNGFKFWIPFYLSKFDNKSSFFELCFVNIIAHISTYFVHFFYDRLFSENNFDDFE